MKILNYAKKLGLKVDIAKSNEQGAAWFYPDCGHIVIKSNNENETNILLAHEIGHYLVGPISNIADNIICYLSLFMPLLKIPLKIQMEEVAAWDKAKVILKETDMWNKLKDDFKILEKRSLESYDILVN